MANNGRWSGRLANMEEGVAELELIVAQRHNQKRIRIVLPVQKN